MAERHSMHTYGKLTHYGLLAITGSDATSFLQGQLTCDMQALKESEHEHKVMLGAYCNIQGRIVASFRVINYQDGFLFIVAKDLVTTLQQTLTKYAVFSKVEFHDVSQNYKIYGFLGSLDIQGLQINQQNVISVQCSKDKTILLVGHNVDRTALPARLTSLITDDVPSNIDTDWFCKETQDGIVTITAATSEKFLPHDVNYPALDAVSFNKGCYLGQEIIARMHYRGKLKQHLYKATIQSTKKIQPMAKLTSKDGDTIGHVVNVVASATNRYLLLAVIKDTDATENNVYFFQQPITISF